MIDSTLQRENNILDEVLTERRHQEAKWGVQNHPSIFPGTFYRIPQEAIAKYICEERAALGTLSWTDIAIEELAEVIGAPGDQARREELVQLQAVILAWIENLDRNVEQLHKEMIDGT